MLVKQGRLKIVEGFTIAEPKTKAAAALVKKMGLKPKSVLVLDKIEPVFEKAARNLGDFQFCLAKDLNSYGVLLSDQLLFTKAALDVLTKRLEDEGAPSAN